MAERPEPAPGLIRLDVRDYMDSTPGFWSAVSLANTQLSAFVKNKHMSSKDKAREQEILDNFNEKYFGLTWLERNARFTVAYEDELKGVKPQLGVDTRDAKFITCTVETYKDNMLVDRDAAVFVKAMGYKALAFRFETKTEVFTIPVEKSILDFTIDIAPPISSERTTVDKLRNCNEKLTHLLHTEIFLSSELEDQKLQIEDCLSYFEDTAGITGFRDGVFELIIDPDEPGAWPVHLAGNHMWLTIPGVMERETPFQSSDDYEYDELHVAVSQTDSDTTHIIPVSRLFDIIDLEAPTEGTLHQDILGRFFENPRIQRVITDIEDHINSINDKDECVEAILEAVHDLHSLVSDDFYDLRFEVKGYVFRNDDEERPTISEKTEEHTGATLEDFEIQYINGRFRVVLPLEIEGADPGDPASDFFYVVPDRAYISVLAGHENTAESIANDSELGIDLVEEFRDCCSETERLVRSHHFRKAPYREQCVMLKNAVEPVNKLIDTLSVLGDEEIINCFTRAYWLVGENEDDWSCREIAGLPQATAPGDNPEQSLVIRGDQMLVIVPEIADSTIKKFHGPFSFPLSNGNPMLIMEDSESGATYYIPLEAISSLIPGVRNEQSGQ